MEHIKISHLFLLQHKVGRIMRLRSGQHLKAIVLTGKQHLGALELTVM